MQAKVQEGIKRSIYDVVNGSVIAILVFSFVLSMGLFSIWLYWMNVEQENLTDSLLQQKVSSYMHDIVTARSLNPSDTDEQLSMILKEFPLHCFHLQTAEGKLIGGQPCSAGVSVKEIELESGGLDVGTLVYKIRVRISAETYIFIITNFLIFFMATTAIWLVLLRNIKNNILVPLNNIANSIDLANADEVNVDEVQEIATLRARILDHTERLKDHVKYEAIAKTTQMLAHDVRKPFTMLKSILDVLEDAPTRDLKSLLKQFSPDVSRALKEVNGLISDIIEIDSKKEPVLDAEGVSEIVYRTLSETVNYKLVQEIQTYKGLEFSSKWGHIHKASLDANKVIRILSNIIINAIHATKGRGKIWFESSEGDGFIKVTVGNSGSVIDPEEGEHLFDAFYTKGKSNGTGLGLAIAKKLVQEHGGEIWYTSSLSDGTEFHFTLPVAQGVLENLQEIPVCVSDFVKESFDNSALDVRSVTPLKAQKKNGNLRLLVCDDEEVYLSMIERNLAQDRVLKKRVELITARTAEECMDKFSTYDVDLCVLDVDLGTGRSGFDLAKEIREQSHEVFICMHSNRDGDAFSANAAKHGANLYLPKPMQKRALQNMFATYEAEAAREGLLVVVDDSLLTLESWKKFFKNRKVVTMQSPEEFERFFGMEGFVKLDKISHLVTDVHFGEVSSRDGYSFAQSLREKGYKNSLFFASDAEIPPEVMIKTSGASVSKVPSEAHSVLS